MSARAVNSSGCSLPKKVQGLDIHSSYPQFCVSVPGILGHFWLKQFHSFVPTMSKEFKAALVS